MCEKMKKQNLIVISMLLLVVLGVSAVQAAECKGTLSGPTKQLIVGETFTITFFNAEPTSTGDNLTLNLPTGLTTTSTNPVNSVNSFTAYSWTVNSTIAGQYNVNISFAMVNCTKSFGPTNVLNKIADPSLGISVDAVANMIKGKQQNANFAIDNTGGNAYNLSGIVATKAGDTILPNTFTKDVLGNHSSNNTQNYTVTITPNACGVGNGLLVHLINYQNAYGDFQVPFTGLSLDFNTTGSDVAITSFTSSPNPVVESAKTNVSITVMNIGTIIAENIFAKIYNGSNLITTLSLGNVAVGGSSTATYEYIAALTGGTHILTAVVDGDTECLASNNNGNTSLQVTAGTCKDGVQNQGEESLDCGGPCTACSTLTTTSVYYTGVTLV